jgi:hypothetical protein
VLQDWAARSSDRVQIARDRFEVETRSYLGGVKKTLSLPFGDEWAGKRHGRRETV